MNRKTLTALGAFVLLAVVALIALRQPEKGERAADQPRPIPKIAAGQVDTLLVTRNGATTTLKKDGDKYQVAAPVAYPADSSAAKGAFEALEKMDLSGLVTDQKAKQAEFEVDDAKGLHVVAKNSKAGDKVVADFVLGKSAGSGTMVRPSGKDEVWQANGISRFTFDKGPADWRDKSVTTFPLADAEKIDVKARDGSKISLKKGAKEGTEDKWEVVGPGVKIEKLDTNVPNGIVSALATFKANDFADGAKPADTGLDAPALTVVVGLKGGKNATVLVGNKKGDDEYYVKTPEAPQVFVAKKWNVERINKRPVEFRDKTLCDLPDGDITEIAVTSTDKDRSYTFVRSGSDWKATKPPKLELDSAKVTPIASAFKDWKASGVAEDPSPKTTGLGKPKATIAVKAKKGSCTVKIGDETKDKQSYFATTAKGPDVYLVPKWSADRILVKPDDLKKAGDNHVAHQ